MLSVLDLGEQSFDCDNPDAVYLKNQIQKRKHTESIQTVEKFITNKRQRKTTKVNKQTKTHG